MPEERKGDPNLLAKGTIQNAFLGSKGSSSKPSWMLPQTCWYKENSNPSNLEWLMCLEEVLLQRQTANGSFKN